MCELSAQEQFQCRSVTVLTVVTFATPDWRHVEAWWPILACNACVALALNTVIALLVMNSSAVAFNLAGIVKDPTTVFAS